MKDLDLMSDMGLICETGGGGGRNPYGGPAMAGRTTALRGGGARTYEAGRAAAGAWGRRRLGTF